MPFRNNPLQTRAELTANMILEAAVILIESESTDSSKITTDQIAKKSGFAVGSIYRYFGSKLDIFSKIWKYFTIRLHHEIRDVINNYPDNGTQADLITLIVNHYFEALSDKNLTQVIKLYRLHIQTCDDPENISQSIDILIEPLDRAIKRNTSGTFKNLTREEIQVYLRAAIAMIRSPILEMETYHGQAQHRKIVIEACCKLFS